MPTHEEVQAVLNQHILPVGMAINAMNQAVASVLGKYVQLIMDEIQHPDGTIGVNARGIYTLGNEKMQIQLNSETLMAIAQGQTPEWTPLQTEPEEQT